MAKMPCGIARTLKKLLELTWSKAACTMDSLSLSKAEVASSSNSILGSLTRALAMAMRCFCPPLNWVPRSPTSVS